jgi:hypothetical protein
MTGNLLHCPWCDFETYDKGTLYEHLDGSFHTRSMLASLLAQLIAEKQEKTLHLTDSEILTLTETYKWEYNGERWVKKKIQ